MNRNHFRRQVMECEPIWQGTDDDTVVVLGQDIGCQTRAVGRGGGGGGHMHFMKTRNYVPLGG